MPAVRMTCRVRACRSLAAVHRSSGTIRRSGTSFTIHSAGGLIRATRLPVSGFLTNRCRFQTRRPTYSSLFSRPVPRFAFPLIVLELHLPPNGPGTASRFKVWAIRFGEWPATNSRNTRSTIAASAGSISRSPVESCAPCIVLTTR